MTNPFEVLQQIQSTYLSAKNREVALSARIPGRHGVVFSVAGYFWIVPLASLTEITSVPQLCFVPSAQRWLRGIFYLREHLVSVTDLSYFLGKDLIHFGRESKILVFFEQGEGFGLLVEKIVALTRFSESDLHLLPQEKINELNSLVNQEVILNEKRFLLLDFSNFLKNSRFKRAVL